MILDSEDCFVYTYDNGGNITSVKEYAYTTGEISGTPVQKTYTYTEWKDLLTNYNGTAITYDAIGNPLNWTNGKMFTWTAGRQLSGVTDANNTITYTYDDNGIRTSKTVNGITTDYYLNGTAIIMQKTGDNCIWYTYDESGNLSGLRAGSSEYYYYRNGQGDIIGIIDGTGSIVAKYSYDAWGNPVAITDGNGNDVSSNASHIANINPFRYRGYFYDVETGLYYLQSRYYDSQVGRFVNADGVVDNRGITTQNLFSYCGNNPVNNLDSSGHLFGPIALFLTITAIGLLTGCQSSNNVAPPTPVPSLLPTLRPTPSPAPSPSPEPTPDCTNLTEEQKKFVAVIAGEAIGANEKTQKAVAHTIMNRVKEPRDVWSKAKSVSDVLIKSQYNAVDGNQYNLAMNYLNNRDGSNAMYENLINAVIPIYLGMESDFTGGAHYIFNVNGSKALLKDLESNPKRYVKCGPFEDISDTKYRMYRCLW